MADSASSLPTSNSQITQLCSLYAHNLSDLGNAERFVAQFGEQVRFVPARGWFFFNGSHWQHDSCDHLLSLAHSSLDTLSDLASSLSDEDEALCLRLLKHIERSQSPTRLKALLSLARTFPGISLPLSAFDSHPHLLTLLNGTLDLTTLELLPHAASHLLTHFIPLAYDPSASSSAWTSFLSLLTNHDHDLARYLQLAVGSSLTGHSSQQLAFVLQGPDQRPLTLFLSLLRQLSGSYSRALPAFKSRILTPDLLGVRLLTCTTLPFLHRCDLTTFSTLLQATPILHRSNSPMTTFLPQTSLWLSAPPSPQLPAHFSTFFPFLKVIPTSLTLTEDEHRLLSAHLSAELPALLSWAIQGAHSWLASGFEEPTSVTAASLALQDDQHDLSSFLDACCDLDSDSTIPARDLYLAYAAYARAQGQQPLSEHKFSPLIQARHFPRSRKTSGRFYHGLRLRLPLQELLTQLQASAGKTTSSRTGQLSTLLAQLTSIPADLTPSASSSSYTSGAGSSAPAPQLAPPMDADLALLPM